MRSLLLTSTQEAASDSYGRVQGQIVQDFDCLDTENINDETRVYALSEVGVVTLLDNAKNLVGKGLILMNISKDKFISYGVIS